MPLVFHDFDAKKVKSFLENSYFFSFQDSFRFITKIKKDKSLGFNDLQSFVELPIDSKKKVFSVLMQVAFDHCSVVLPGNCYDYVKKNDYPYNIPDLLEYVIMDAFLNLEQKFLSQEAPEKLKYESLKEFFRDHVYLDCFLINDLNNEDSIEEGISTDRGNYSHRLKLSRHIPFIEKYFIAEDSKKKNSIPISKSYDNINGLLVALNNYNPYGFSGAKRVSNISFDNLKAFFVELLYPNLIKSSEARRPVNSLLSRYNFCFRDDIEYIKAMHYLDVHYDLISNLYAATKLNEYEKQRKLNATEKELILELLSQIILIPDVFHKNCYIDIILKTLFSNEIMETHYSKMQEIVSEKEIVDENVFKSNLFICKEYISYISKIFLPIVSCYFYVLISELIENEKTLFEVLKIAVVEIVGEYYDRYCNDCMEYFEFANKTDIPASDVYALNLQMCVRNGLEENLQPLYKKIKNNFFTEYYNYENILRSLSVEPNIDYINMKTLEFNISMKVKNNSMPHKSITEIIQNPIIEEKEVREYIGISKLYVE